MSTDAKMARFRKQMASLAAHKLGWQPHYFVGDVLIVMPGCKNGLFFSSRCVAARKRESRVRFFPARFRASTIVYADAIP